MHAGGFEASGVAGYRSYLGALLGFRLQGFFFRLFRNVGRAVEEPLAMLVRMTSTASPTAITISPEQRPSRA